MSGSNTGQQSDEGKNFQRFVGAGVGIFALGAVAFISAPVAIPAIGVGLGAIGLSALSGTAIASGFFVTSAVVGGVVGGFSAPSIYEATSGLFEKKENGEVDIESRDSESNSLSPSGDNGGNNGTRQDPNIHTSHPPQPNLAPRGGPLPTLRSYAYLGGGDLSPEEYAQLKSKLDRDLFVPSYTRVSNSNQLRRDMPPARKVSIDPRDIPSPLQWGFRRDGPQPPAAGPLRPAGLRFAPLPGQAVTPPLARPAEEPSPAPEAPQPNLDAKYIESFACFRGTKRKYQQLENQSQELQEKVKVFKHSNAVKGGYYERFSGFNSRNKDLYFFQYEKAKQEIETMAESRGKILDLSHNKIEDLKKFYPKKDFVGDETVKDFLERNLEKINNALKSLNSRFPTHPVIIKDKIVKLNMAIAIIEERITEKRPSPTFCMGRAVSACLPTSTSKGPAPR
jgi:hypothetical protein